MNMVDEQLKYDLTWFEQQRRDILYHQSQGYEIAFRVLEKKNRIGRVFTSQRQVDEFKEACADYRDKFNS